MNDEIEYLRKVYQSEDTSTWVNKLQMKSIVDYADKLQSNWNSLKEWITKENNNYHYGLRSGKTLLYGKFLGRVDVLDKMNELERGEK